MRRRLFALLVAPLVVLLLIGAQLTARVTGDRESAEAAAQVVEIATKVADLDRALGHETLVAVATNDGADGQPMSLGVAVSTTDSAVRNLALALDGSNPANDDLFEALDQVRVALAGRTDLSEGLVSPLQLVDRYRSVRQGLVQAMVGRATAANDTRYAHDVLGLIALVEARSAHLDERVSVDLVLRYNAWAPGQHSGAVVTVSLQRTLIDRAVALAEATAPQESQILAEARSLLLTSDVQVPELTRDEWSSQSDDWLRQLNQEVDSTAVRIQRRVNDDAASAVSAQRFTVGGIILATAIAVLTAAFSGLRLVRRVRRIADAAGDLSLEQAPVAFLRDGGSDEIAEMADAFDRMSARIQQASAIRDVEAEVRASILSERPLEDTLAACTRLLPAGHSFAVAHDHVYLVDPKGAATLINDSVVETSSEESQLAVGLAKVAQLRWSSLRALRHQATHDALTHLLNRSAALRMLAELCRKGRPAVLYLDLDNFKRLNDVHGHERGDRALKEVATVLDDIARSMNAVAGRLGGDEFIMIINDDLDDEVLRTIGADIVDRVQALTGVASTGLTASVGIAPNRFGQSASQLVHEADAAMYRAKHDGRNRVVLADESIRQEIEASDDIERGLVRALILDEFTVVYQGIWDVHGERLEALEALARWTDMDGRAHSPAAFFAAAERLGRAHEIDRLILAKVGAQVHAWKSAGLAVPAVHVNMSAQTLSKPDVVAGVLSTLQRTGCPPQMIVAEITESAFISEIDSASSRLDELRAHGIRIAVDDFGEGYSSLRYLSKLPIDILKIDRQFIDHIDSNQNNRAIVRAVVSLASTLDMMVVAEGVERVEEQSQLADIGCSHIQGYLLGRPADPQDIQGLIARSSQSATPTLLIPPLPMVASTESGM